MRPKRDPGSGGALIPISAGIVGAEPRYRWRRTTQIRQIVFVYINRALVATPGASEWVSCVSSPATNRPGRTLEKGAGNLANSPAAFQISLTIRKPTADAEV
jgi:hypothetical protein